MSEEEPGKRSLPSPLIRIHILEVNTGLQAHAIRSAAEHFGAFVTITWVGNATQIVDYLSNFPTENIIIISGHGEEQGLCLPEVGSEFKSLYPYNDVIRPADFAEFLHLTGNIVINASCMGGTPEMAAAFLAHGAEIYIGASGYPDSAASTKYILDFLYSFLLQYKGSVQKAHETASSGGDDRRHFQIYHDTAKAAI